MTRPRAKAAASEHAALQLRDAMDRLEGYPRQGVYASGRKPPEGVGITEHAGYVRQHPTTGEWAFICDMAIVNRNDGREVELRGPNGDVGPKGERVSVRAADFAELAPDWFPEDDIDAEETE